MALGSRFLDRTCFDEFYESLNASKRIDEFHRVTNLYLFLVKRGDWHISVEGYDTIIDYFTNTFKLVALFSLIESLTELKHQDFYQWLSSQDQSTIFPISSKSDLSGLYDEYKKSFGSIRRCINFFERLPDQQKNKLCQSIQIDGVPIASIKKLAQFLYNIRSEFVHAAQLVLCISDSTIFHLKEKGLNRSSLSLDILLDAFEEGVIAYFKKET
ncbi:hypothetical protein KKA69_06340 [Patescibacteria group bacterium]|nr:hypothetical protein [Patescibacteria group bacterium]